MAGRNNAKGAQRAPRATKGNIPERTSAGDPAQGPAAQGTLSSGYSSRSSTGGTGGGALKPRGSGYSPGDDSRLGATPNEADPLAAEGVAAGAAGFRTDTAYGRLKPGASGAEEEEMGTDGGAAVTGVSGVSGGGRGTTSSTNTRR
jgi:hypothetical protein